MRIFVAVGIMGSHIRWSFLTSARSVLVTGKGLHIRDVLTRDVFRIHRPPSGDIGTEGQVRLKGTAADHAALIPNTMQG